MEYYTPDLKPTKMTKFNLCCQTLMQAVALSAGLFLMVEVYFKGKTSWNDEVFSM